MIYNLEIRPNTQEIIDFMEFDPLVDYAYCAFAEYYKMHWLNMKSDMIYLSEKFPNNLFIVTRSKEVGESESHFYFYGGREIGI